MTTTTAVANVHRGAKGGIYVLPHLVGSRRIHPTTRNAAWDILAQYEDDYRGLIPDMATAFDQLRDTEGADIDRLRVWGPLMHTALDAGGPWPHTDPRRPDLTDWRDASTRQHAYAQVWAAGWHGVTSAEARRGSGVNSDGISGSLSLFHRAGIVAKLVEKR